MTQGAIRWLARLVLTSLMIASLVLAGVNLATLARAPAGVAFVERSTAGIEAATERALLVHATPDTITTRLTSLLTEEPRNWFAIEAVESLAAERALSLPVDLRHKRAAAWEQDNGFWQSAGECARCAWDARTCELSTILMCRAPVDLSPLGDLAGVIRGGTARPLWASCGRHPLAGTSTVTNIAPKPASLARLIRSSFTASSFGG